MRSAGSCGMAVLVLCSWLFGTGGLFAEEEIPFSEEELVREMERLVDETGEITEEELEKARNFYDRGIRAHDLHDFEKALELYRKALEINPLFSEAYYELALTFSRMGNQSAALENITRALVIEPKSDQFYILKGSILDNMGMFEKSVATYRALLEIDPDNYLGRVNLAISYMRKERWDEAEAELLRAAENQPEAPSAFFHLATIANVRGYNYDEEKYLSRFVEVGREDSRLPAVEERLKGLRDQEITVDPSEPYAEIRMAEQMMRAGWKAQMHRERFPEARGYRLTYEEERSIYAETVLPMWREEKKKDPSAAHGRYDLLLMVDDAGYLDEYIYYVNQNTFGEAGQAWMDENAERMDAFLAWAKKEGLLAEPEAKPPEEAGAGTSLFEKVLLLADRSELTYTVDVVDDGGEDLLDRERELFARKLKLKGEDAVDCARASKRLPDELFVTGSAAFVPVFRCRLPGEAEWDAAESMLSSVGMRMVDRAPRIDGGTTREGDEVRVAMIDPKMISYYLSKAVWKNEASLRAEYGEEGKYRPSVMEEVFAWTALAQSYLNMKQGAGSGEAEDFKPDPYLENLIEIGTKEMIRGFVLFEVLHKTYGLSLRSLDSTDAGSVQEYLETFVLVKVD